MADPQVKAEPEESPDLAGTPADEEDLYEDAGDLDFYSKAPGANNETLYLARVPQYVWESWMKLTERLGDDDEIRIGTLRTWNEQKPDGTPMTKLRMLLQDDQPEHQAIPKEYNIELADSDVKNHFIFSEEDLPGFKAKNKARADAGHPGGGMSAFSRARDGRGERSGYDRRGGRYQPYYRKAIPKKTKLYGKIHYEVRAEPSDREEEDRLVGRQIFEMEHGRPGLQIISRNKASTITNLGTAGSVNWASNFIKNAPTVAKPKKGETVKAARIPKDQLLDLIFECFRQYQYWPMKALRQKTQQPDAYLRQVLEEVAVLIKSGRFANNYALSDAYKDKSADAKEEAAAAAEGDDDDEEEEMEDVLPAAP